MNLDKKTLEYARKRLEYKKKPIKFIQECVKIPTPGGSMPMKLFPPQKKIVKSFFEDHHLISLKSRQIGISTIFQAIITYVVTFYDNVVIGVVSRDNPEASDFCRKVQNMLEELPDWLRPEFENCSIQYFILKNGCQMWASTVSLQNPEKTLRGKAISILVIDEAAFIPKVDIAWTGMSQNSSRAHLDAKANGIPYGNVIISTPNKTEGIGKWFYQMWRGAGEDNYFTPHKIHWSEVPAYADDPNWYKERCESLNNDSAKIAQELDLKFVGTEGSLFDEKVQLQLQDRREEPIKHISIPKSKYKIWQFQEIRRRNFHIIGVDVASAAGLDNSAIQVIEYHTMNQVMEFCENIGPKEFAGVVKLVSIHCPHNLIVIENTGGYGLAVIEELLDDNEMEFNLFGEYKEKKDRRVEFEPGLKTTVRTRPLILDSLYETVRENPQIIRSERLAAELLGLVNKRNKVEADKGFKDDLALAYGFCCYVRKYCSEVIGYSQALPDDAVTNNQIITKGEMIKKIVGMNETSPLAGARRLNDGIDLKEQINGKDNWSEIVTEYINDKFSRGELVGNVNIMDLWKQ